MQQRKKTDGGQKDRLSLQENMSTREKSAYRERDEGESRKRENQRGNGTLEKGVR